MYYNIRVVYWKVNLVQNQMTFISLFHYRNSTCTSRWGVEWNVLAEWKNGGGESDCLSKNKKSK